MVTSSSGFPPFALAAALGPAADPPMMTSFSFFNIFLSSYLAFNFRCFLTCLAYAEYLDGNIVQFEVLPLEYLRFQILNTLTCKINNLPTMLANEMAVILFLVCRLVIETVHFYIEPFNEI